MCRPDYIICGPCNAAGAPAAQEAYEPEPQVAPPPESQPPPRLEGPPPSAPGPARPSPTAADFEAHGDACVAALVGLQDQLARPRDAEPLEHALQFMWHWNAGTSGWQPYPTNHVLVLEHQLCRGRAPQAQLNSGYTVDLREMRKVQYNATDTWQFKSTTPDRMRPVRRALWYSNHDAGLYQPLEPEASVELEAQFQQKNKAVYRLEARKEQGFARGWIEVCEHHTNDTAALMDLVAGGYEYAITAHAVEAMTRVSWSAEAWKTAFDRELAVRNYAGTKALRVLVMRTTLTVLAEAQYTNDAGAPVPLDLAEMLRPAIETHRHTPQQYAAEQWHIPAAARGVQRTEVSVVGTDCVEVGLTMQDDGLTPAVLNMANAFHAGGGYLSGAGAQEENICRRSAYCLALEAPDGLRSLLGQTEADHYPFGDVDGMYTPDVLVLRSSEDTGYAWLEQPRKLSFIAVAAIERPRVTRHSPPQLEAQARQLTKEKVRTILRIGFLHQHDALVLSALGCGAFANPPYDVAALFDEVLREGEFQGVFKKIVFAILDDQNAGRAHNPDGNFLPFLKKFGDGTGRGEGGR